MTMASSLLPGNPKRIDSCICDSSHIFKPVIDYHQLAQLNIVIEVLNKGFNISYKMTFIFILCTFLYFILTI